MTTSSFAFSAILVCTIGTLLPVNSHAQSQAEMNRNAAKSFETADAELNLVYKQFMSKIDNQSQAKLKKAQKAWVLWRDAQADLVADFEARDGSMAPMIHDGQRAVITRARTAELRKLMKEYAE